MRIFARIVCTAVIAMSCIISCNKDEAGTAETIQYANVRLNISSPNMKSKAIGDGEKTTDLYYAAFVDGKPVSSIQDKIDMADGMATINLQVVKNVNYQFAFWAQAEFSKGESSPYDLSSFNINSIVAVNYNGLSNDDTRDAFCAMKNICVTDAAEEKVFLQRPFAQVNFGSSDYECVKYLGLHADMLSEAHIYGLPDQINVLEGSVSSSDVGCFVNAAFSFAPIPSGEDEYIIVNGVEYGYVNMNYVLASSEGETISVSATVVSGDSKWEISLVPNVPVRRNHKTNIIGDLFTEDATLQIIMEPDFTAPDENITR